jgi:hypothetical protein
VFPFSISENNFQLYHIARHWKQVVNADIHIMYFSEEPNNKTHQLSTEEAEIVGDVWVLAFGSNDMNIVSTRNPNTAHAISMQTLAERLTESGLLCDGLILRLYWCDPGKNAKEKAKTLRHSLGDAVKPRIHYYPDVFLTVPQRDVNGEVTLFNVIRYYFFRIMILYGFFQKK